jgi:hypothetical protein
MSFKPPGTDDSNVVVTEAHSTFNPESATKAWDIIMPGSPDGFFAVSSLYTVVVTPLSLGNSIETFTRNASPIDFVVILSAAERPDNRNVI